jgi:mRNA-degrading endonuclease toxin of MazEF toxin-antitoxin module
MAGVRHEARVWLVVQNDAGNRRSNFTIVTSPFARKPGVDLYPCQVAITRADVAPAPGEHGLDVDSVADTAHIYTIPRAAITRVLGQVTPTRMSTLNDALKASLGITDAT